MALSGLGSTALLYAWIALGGALGSVARFWCTSVAIRLFGESFPWGTVFVNITGSFLIGLFITLTEPDGRVFASPTMRHFVAVGILGGYTTFSAFSLQTLHLLNGSQWLPAAGNVLGSVALCLLAVWLGHMLAMSLNTMKWM